MDPFSFKIGDTGTVLNPNDMTLPFVDLTNIQGLDTPDLRTTERDHEGVDGGFIDAEFEKMRTIVLEGQLISNDPESVMPFLDSLKAQWAVSNTAKTLYFGMPGVTDRVIFAKTLGVRYDVNQLWRTGACDVQFMCQAEDPRIYDNNLQVFNLAQGVAITNGFSFNLSFDFGFGAPVDPNQTNVFNGGNRPTPAVITIPGPVTNPIIYNDTTSNTLQFEIVVASGDYLQIDLGYRTVKLNGSVSRRATLIEPDWFLLEEGDNFMRYRASTSGGAAATVSMRNAWR